MGAGRYFPARFRALGLDGRLKSRWIEVDEEALDDELRYLRTEIHRYSDADPPVKRPFCLRLVPGPIAISAHLMIGPML